MIYSGGAFFASSNDDTFDIKNLWTSFTIQGENACVKKPKFLREKVDFSAPTVKSLSKGERHRVLIGCTSKRCQIESITSNINGISN